MMCQECGQREANICFTTIINGEKHEEYLCQECVSKKQLLKFDLSQLAAQLSRKKEPEAPEAPVPRLSCPACGMTYAQFLKEGALGCPQCYQAFREPLEGYLMKKLNRAKYAGDAPEQAGEQVSLRMERDKLKRKLHRAVEEEDYEQAAALRDRIRALNTRLEEAEHE